MTRAKSTETFYVIAYDIPNDRRRARVHRILCGFGRWTQYSVFECHLTEKQMVLLRSKLDRHLRPDEDSIRFYQLCADCMAKTETIGSQKPAAETLYLV